MTSGGGVEALPAVAIAVIQVPMTVASAWTLAISGLDAHWVTTGPSDVAVEASIFGQVAIEDLAAEIAQVTRREPAGTLA